MQIFLQASNLGTDLGPNFTLTADVGPVSPSTLTRSQLLFGVSVTVDENATVITVTSVGTCSNFITVPIADNCDDE